MATLTAEFTSTPDDFGEDAQLAYRQVLAAFIGVNASDIVLEIRAASVLVVATITAALRSDANAIVAALEGLTPTGLTAALAEQTHLNLTVVEDSLQTSVQFFIVVAPSPPPHTPALSNLNYLGHKSSPPNTSILSGVAVASLVLIVIMLLMFACCRWRPKQRFRRVPGRVRIVPTGAAAADAAVADDAVEAVMDVLITAEPQAQMNPDGTYSRVHLPNVGPEADAAATEIPHQVELLIFACSPKVSPLGNLDDEATRISNHCPASIQRGGTASDLRKSLMHKPTKRFAFLGHANVSLPNVSIPLADPHYMYTLGFTNPAGGLVAVNPSDLAQVLGLHSNVLELVFLNGCCSLGLGQAVQAAGVKAVVCWETKVETKAAAIFSNAFFEALAKGFDYKMAFEQSKLAVTTVTIQGTLPDGMASEVPKYELRDPDVQVPPSASPGSSPVPWAAGILQLLLGRTEYLYIL